MNFSLPRGTAWGVVAALFLIIGLVTTVAYAASITVTAQPLQNTGANGAVTYSADYSAASAIVTRHENSAATLNISNQITSVTVAGTKASGAANATVQLKNSAGTVLDSGTAALPTTARPL